MTVFRNKEKRKKKKKKPRLICPGFDYIRPFSLGETNGRWPNGKAIGPELIKISIIVIKKPPLLGEVS